jgi:hypothetical protein
LPTGGPQAKGDIVSDILKVLKEKRDSADRYNNRENKMVHDVRKVEMTIGTANAVISEIESNRADIDAIKAERDAALETIARVKRDYLAGEYTAMALNLFDGEIADAPTPPPAPAVDAAPVGITDEAFAAVMHNLDTMTARQSLSHASLQKDYADGYIEDGELEKAAENMSAAIGHLIDALLTMQKEKAQS